MPSNAYGTAFEPFSVLDKELRLLYNIRDGAYEYSVASVIFVRLSLQHIA